MSVFEVLNQEQWNEAGAGGSAEKGEYGRILSEFASAGARYAQISTETGRFAGKQASSITTALKNARDGKSAPEGVENLRISSRKGTIFLENPAVEG
jgi:hypothetical protein